MLAEKEKRKILSIYNISIYLLLCFYIFNINTKLLCCNWSLCLGEWVEAAGRQRLTSSKSVSFSFTESDFLLVQNIIIYTYVCICLQIIFTSTKSGLSFSHNDPFLQLANLSSKRVSLGMFFVIGDERLLD